MKRIQLIALFIILSITVKGQRTITSDEEIPLADLLIMVDSANTNTIKEILSGKHSANLRSVKFNTGKITLDSKEQLYLDTVADYLVNIPTIEMSIDGHTDNVGSYPKNKSLSLNRAKAVSDYLVKKGVRKGQLKAVGFGPDKPLVSNTTPTGRATNRRVELRFLETKFDEGGSSKSTSKGGKSNSENLTRIKLKDGSTVDAKFVSYSSDGKQLRYIPNGPDETVKILRIPDIESINYPDGTVSIPENKPDPIPTLNAFQAAKEEVKKREVVSSNSNQNAKETETPKGNEAQEKPKFLRKFDNFKHDTKYGKYLSGNFMFVSVGILPLTIRSNNEVLNITNKSGASYKSSLAANNNPSGIGIQIGMEREFGASRPNTYYRYMYQWATIGGAQMNLFTFGLGKSLGRLKQYRYGLDVGTGYSQKKLADIELKGSTYAVNNVSFNGNKVSVRYRNGYFAFTPNVTYELYLGKLFAALRLNSGYTLSLHRRTTIKLKGQSTESPVDKTFVDVGNSSYYLTEGTSTSSEHIIYGIGGFHVTAGLIFK